MSDPACGFCAVDPAREWLSGALAYATLDRYPVSPGHLLIIPRRHVTSWFGTTEEERGEILVLLDRARQLLREVHLAAGVNIGIDDGLAAGQLVAHLHVHVIPRYPGDMADPRGGVRWIFPERAVYWKDK